MNVFKKILVQIDPTRPMNKAPACARALAELTGSELVALYIIDEKMTGILGADLITAMDAALESVAEEALESYMMSVAERVQTNKAIGYGDTSETLAKYVIRHQVDLIVTGGFHPSVYQRIPFGSIVNEIIRKSPCSVLLYREAHRDPLVPGKVVAAYDGSPGARRALHQAAAFAALHGSELDIVHVHGRGGRARAESLLADVVPHIERSGVTVESHPLRRPIVGSRTRAILRHAKSVDARCIALAAKGGRTGFGGLSPIVEHLVIHTDRPLLVIQS